MPNLIRGLMLFTLMFLPSLLIGCGAESSPQTPPAPTALTFEEWQKLEVSYKYDPAAFDRLRMGDPNLQSEPAWDHYFKTVILPERNKDIPPTPGQFAPK